MSKGRVRAGEFTHVVSVVVVGTSTITVDGVTTVVVEPGTVDVETVEKLVLPGT
jgi:hypothetical protein